MREASSRVLRDRLRHRQLRRRHPRPRRRHPAGGVGGRPGQHATAVFYYVEGPEHDGPPRAFGRAAIAAYVDGADGRLMRSMKSILGSSLVDQTTDVGGGRGVKYLDIVAGYLRHIKRLAEAQAGAPIARAVLGRPVFFVDDDPARDAQAQAALESAARAARLDRRDDILANHGVHIAGTDFDRRIELMAILPPLGYGACGPSMAGAAPREVPSAVYFDLATWHLINTVYTPQRVAELRGMRGWYAEPRHHERLMTVLDERLGHELAARAEGANIAVADGGATRIDLGLVERALAVDLGEDRAVAAIDDDLARIVAAARDAARQAGLPPQRIDALYFTGGSTGLRPLAQRIAAEFPAARVVLGDRFASVATGLGVFARRLYGSG